MEELSFWYNGYRFSPDRNIRIYNPISVMNALTERKFKNYWFETGPPSFLVNLLKERFYDIPLLEDWEADLEMFKIYELDYLPAEAVLYQAGYLTIKEVSDIDPNTVILSYPNEEVKRSFCRVMFWQGLEVPGSKKELQVNLQEPYGMSVLKR